MTHWLAIRKKDGVFYLIDSLEPIPVAMNTSETIDRLMSTIHQNGHVLLVHRLSAKS